MLIQLGADDHQLAAHIGTALTDFPLAGNVIELQPAVGTAVHDALGAEDHAVIAGVQLGEGVLNVSLGELLGRLDAPAGKDLVGVVVMVVVMMAAVAVVMMVLMLVMVIVVFVVVVMAAAAMAVMLILVMIMMMMLMLVMVIVILVVKPTGLFGEKLTEKV